MYCQKTIACSLIAILCALLVPVGAQAAPGDNCAINIVDGVPNGIDWNQVFIVRGADGSAWQRAVVSNGGGLLQLNEFNASSVYGIAQPGSAVQVFIFAPRYTAGSRMAKPDHATCFEADTNWNTTEGLRNVQIGSGYFGLPLNPRFLWPSIGNDMVVDAFFRRQESWEELMKDQRYGAGNGENQNFFIGTHLKPTLLEISGTRDNASCKSLCDKGPAVGVELQPTKLPTKLRGNNFNAVNGRETQIGRMPGIHTFYAGFKGAQATTADKAALRRIAHMAMGMEAFKRAILGNQNANGRPPGLPFISADQLRAAATGALPNVSVDTVQLIRSAATLMLGDHGGGTPRPVPYPEDPTRAQQGFNIFNPTGPTATPGVSTGQQGATPVVTAPPVGGLPGMPGGLPSAPAMPNFPSSLTPPSPTPSPVPAPTPDDRPPEFLPPPPAVPASANLTGDNGIAPLRIVMEWDPPQSPSNLNLPNADPGTLSPPSNFPSIPGLPSGPPIIPGGPSSSPGVLQTPKTLPNLPTQPIVPPPGRSIFDGMRTEPSLTAVGAIVNRGNLPNLQRDLFPVNSSTEQTWAQDMVTLINFWTGSLRVNPCLLADDRFMAENFRDQPATFNATQCTNYLFVSGMTPRLVLSLEDAVDLLPDFAEATLTETDQTLNEHGAFALAAGKKPALRYLYDLTTPFSSKRSGEACLRQSDLPALVQQYAKEWRLNAREVTALAAEFHEAIQDETAFYRLRFADQDEIASRLVWKANGQPLDITRVFFEADKDACDRADLSVPNIAVPEDRDGFEAGILH